MSGGGLATGNGSGTGTGRGFLPPAGLLREVRETGNGNPPLLHDGAAGGGPLETVRANQCLGTPGLG
jgi:hypothetical protein